MVEVAGSNPAAVTAVPSSTVLLLEILEAAMSDVKQVIVVRKDLNMRKGKIAAQVAHASMKFLVDNNEAERGDEIKVKLSPAEAEWLLSGSFTKVVVGCDSEEALESLIFQAELADVEVHPIIDNGRTEFNGVKTLTCAAFGPCTAEELDKITGNLKLI
jgi:PTH2 family peptidyl-tRNA hydrolase